MAKSLPFLLRAEMNIEKIEEILKDPLEHEGYGIVRLAFHGGSKKGTLQILIENLDERPVSVEDCIKVNRLSSVILDVEDPIQDPYVLEVSSPGIDRPLVQLKDFERFKGKKARVELYDPIGGRKKFSGLLKGVNENEEILLEALSLDGENMDLFAFPHNEIQKACLVFELLKEENKKVKK